MRKRVRPPARLMNVLRDLNAGRTTADIAHKRGLTHATVRQYVKCLYAYFNGRTTYDIVLEARRRHLVPTPNRDVVRPPWLTPLRLTCLTLARAGLSHNAIARRLKKRQGAIDKIFEYIRKELHVSTTAEAVDEAIARGLLAGTTPRTTRNVFSSQEIRILGMLGARNRPTDIGRRLHVKGIFTRLRRMRAKLRVDSNDAMLIVAERLGLYRQSPRVTREVFKRIARHDRPETLTDRQHDVMDALRRNPRQRVVDLADALGTSTHTIVHHLFIIYRFYGVRNRKELLVAMKIRRHRRA